MPYYRCRVVSVTPLSPHLTRVTLSGPDLADYKADGHPDDYCRVLFPHPGHREPVVPHEVDGREAVPEGELAALARNYTIRAYDAATATVVIDFALHERGVGTEWARRAAPGDHLAITDADGRHHPPAHARWQHLAGDLTALPAIGRIVEEAAAGTVIHVSAVVPDAADRMAWKTSAVVTVDWIVEPDPRKVGAALLAAVIDRTPPEGPGYTWVAGENTACRLARKHLRHERGLPGEQYSTLGYWRVDDERWLHKYEQVKDEVERRIQEADSRIPDDEAFTDEVDRIYDEAGLGW